MNQEEWAIYTARKAEEYYQKTEDYHRKRAESARKAALRWLAALVVLSVGLVAVGVMAMLGV